MAKIRKLNRGRTWLALLPVVAVVGLGLAVIPAGARWSCTSYPAVGVLPRRASCTWWSKVIRPACTASFGIDLPRSIAVTVPAWPAPSTP